MNLTDQFESLTSVEASDCQSFKCKPEALVEVVTHLRDKESYELLTDVTAIDNGETASPRFTGVYHLVSIKKAEYLRLIVDCDDDVEPKLPSIASVYTSADWHERETYDMFGIVYENHPDLRRIMMWDEYEHFPLRKDFPLAGFEEEYPEADVVERTGVKITPAPMMGGPFVASSSGAMSENEPRAKDQSWSEGNRKG